MALLRHYALQYNTTAFIARDPICIPHRFSALQDVEIAALFAAVFAWGNRTTILNKATDLLARMDNAPHQFVCHHTAADLRRLLAFSHRTFNDVDLLYFVDFLHRHYKVHHSLEAAFPLAPNAETVEGALKAFHNSFFAVEHAPERTRKHIGTPARGSACKRLCMFLRWMVRRDAAGVDLGLWCSLSPAQLVVPLDVHSARTARSWGLLARTPTDWKAALELTATLRLLDPTDPVRFDYALFGYGVNQEG